jgi:hypothetical protein
MEFMLSERNQKPPHLQETCPLPNTHCPLPDSVIARETAGRSFFFENFASSRGTLVAR